ncbi:phosphatidic acid phosphatase type 2/haloperoxidase [Pseudohyphozyma bogoriensis]|nr:phosphatidic acid phosphatase type 2/haloperoxidase [Pseudohyphozyma bogoriensis]
MVKLNLPVWAKRITSAPALAFFTPAFIVDWVTPVVLNHISIWVEQQYPYERPVEKYLNDATISFSHVLHERVPSYPDLDRITFWLPLGLMLLISAFRRSLHEAHHAALALVASRAIMRIVVECGKNRVGRLRPDFLDRCQWDPVAMVCTGAEKLVKDGRRSFPSGHSATSWQGLFLLTLFIAGKNGAFAFKATFPSGGLIQSRVLRFSLAVAPMFLAAWVCITRLEDHYHHVEDVLAGSTIGILSAISMYLIYFPSPFATSSVDLETLGCANAVYVKREDDGALRLEEGLGGEADGQGLLVGGGREEV